MGMVIGMTIIGLPLSCLIAGFSDARYLPAQGSDKAAQRIDLGLGFLCASGILRDGRV